MEEKKNKKTKKKTSSPAASDISLLSPFYSVKASWGSIVPTQGIQEDLPISALI